MTVNACSEGRRSGSVTRARDGFPRSNSTWINPPRTIRTVVPNAVWTINQVGMFVFAGSFVSPDNLTTDYVYNRYGDDYFMAPDGSLRMNGRDDGAEISDRFALFESINEAFFSGIYKAPFAQDPMAASAAVFQLEENWCEEEFALDMKPIVRFEVQGKANGRLGAGPVIFTAPEMSFSIGEWIKWTTERIQARANQM